MPRTKYRNQDYLRGVANRKGGIFKKAKTFYDFYGGGIGVLIQHKDQIWTFESTPGLLGGIHLAADEAWGLHNFPTAPSSAASSTSPSSSILGISTSSSSPAPTLESSTTSTPSHAASSAASHASDPSPSIKNSCSDQLIDSPSPVSRSSSLLGTAAPPITDSPSPLDRSEPQSPPMPFPMEELPEKAPNTKYHPKPESVELGPKPRIIRRNGRRHNKPIHAPIALSCRRKNALQSLADKYFR